MKWTPLLLLLLLPAASGSDAGDARRNPTAGDRLEAAALAAGLVSEPGAALTGVYAGEGDRLCISAQGRAGVSVDYGEGQRCLGRGTASRRGEDRIDIRLGDCAIAARRDGDRIVFPASLPPACTALCRGRATLDALSVERLSAAPSEASAARDFRNDPLCSD